MPAPGKELKVPYLFHHSKISIEIYIPRKNWIYSAIK
jgi:hypothetical protein